MIVGRQVANHMRTELPLDALEMALWRRRIKKDSGLIHHSDRGPQYVSIRYTDRLSAWNLSSSGLVLLDRFGAFDRLSDVVTCGPLLVPRAGRPSRAWLGRFRCCRWASGSRADVAKPPPHPGRGEAAGLGGRSQGRRRSSASGRARRSWVWATMTSQVHRSALSAWRIFGVVQPRVCFRSLKVCSRSNAVRLIAERGWYERGVAGWSG